MKTATIIYRWTAKTSSRCLGRYYTASTLLEAIKAGKEFVAREFHGTGSVLIEASLDGGKEMGAAENRTPRHERRPHNALAL